MTTNYQDIITIEHGKACIRNSRITVFDVFTWLANSMTQAEIIEDYPELTVTDIQACFAYAADREKSTMPTIDAFKGDPLETQKTIRNKRD